ncbi:peptidoglycan editing factor PgeF [Pelomonas sp. KK5]|uniref:peptidoglycan editing factor PgeF n=1 Tax=Pelomonas sp. KK5 TaxID=1855730 RepID=UPI00097CB84F|nr:peptidoglycan editing factor PgeF [Pelomonas sp. KK5]
MHSDWLRPDWPLAHVHAFMTTRAGGVSTGPRASMNVGRSVQDDPAAVAENRARVSAALGAPALFMPQVHGVEVLRLQPAHVELDTMPAADAAVSTDPALGVAIQVADCLPVLFAAPRGVAGAHAGWRGLAGGVLENTVRSLCEAAECRPQDIHAWLGACIGPEAFEVGADVLQAFGVEPSESDKPYFVHRPNAAGEARWRADLAGLARKRLHGLQLASVSGGGLCTFSEDSRFFSYRRERFGGRMVAAIRLL